MRALCAIFLRILAYHVVSKDGMVRFNEPSPVSYKSALEHLLIFAWVSRVFFADAVRVFWRI